MGNNLETYAGVIVHLTNLCGHNFNAGWVQEDGAVFEYYRSLLTEIIKASSYDPILDALVFEVSDIDIKNVRFPKQSPDERIILKDEMNGKAIMDMERAGLVEEYGDKNEKVIAWKTYKLNRAWFGKRNWDEVESAEITLMFGEKTTSDVRLSYKDGKALKSRLTYR